MTIRCCLLAALYAFSTSAQTIPKPSISAIVNQGSYDNHLSPGCGSVIFGFNLGPAQAVAGAAPGLSVTANGRTIPVLFSSASEVEVQLPFDLATGPANIQLVYQGFSSAAFPIQVAAYAPSLATRTAGSGVLLLSFAAANPNFAAPGEMISVFAFGLGATNPPATAGQSVAAPAPTAVKPSVTVNGEVSTVLFAGLTPARNVQNIPLYQINIAVPGDLVPGSYPIVLSIGGFSSPTLLLPVNITGVVPTQTGFTFQAVQGGGAPSPSTFRILNGTSQALNYTLSISTVSGGSGWLSASPLSGSIVAGQGATISVSVNPSTLTPGDYYGQIRIDAQGAQNSPRFLSVVLNVSGPAVNPGPVLDQTGLVFVSLVSGSDPAAQSIKITNLTNRTSPFTATTSAASTQNPFTVAQSSGTVTPNQPASASIQPRTSGLAVGVYRGSLTLQFPQDNTSRVVDLLLVVTPVLPAAASAVRLPESAAATCKPTKLLPVFTLLGSNFNILIAWPTPIEVKVVDDCGTALTNGSVSVTFSNGDPQITLVSGGDGRWSGTWAAVNPRSSSLTATATAIQADFNISGTAQVGGAAQSNADVPVLGLNGMVNSGSYASTASPSVGELVAVFGLNMADGTETASVLPLGTRLQNATLTLGGLALPLVFTSTGQINAQLPYSLLSVTMPQLVLQHGNRLSAAQPVTIAPAEPGIFTIDKSGSGQGHIYVIPAPGVQVLADSSAPAKAGDILQIYCTGLGAVTPPVTAGTATPFDALRNSVTKAGLTIGGVPADVLFSGLTPGFTGLYQINATVPAGVASANDVPVVVTLGLAQSPPVNMAVK